MGIATLMGLGALLLCHRSSRAASEWQRPPISYNKTRTSDPAALLQARLESGKATLARDDQFGFLPALLRELQIPVSSQSLVFSKTSFQRDRISPDTPRALYFNDDVYVGFVHDAEVVEIAAADPKVGMSFYTLDQRTQKPRITRQTENCLQCHGASMTRDLPGLMVRSVFSDLTGQPVFSAGTFLSTHESPMNERWGGWYVTGTVGKQQHMGNAFLNPGADPLTFDYAGTNVTDLSQRFDTKQCLTAHSDLVALMMLEHQAEMHNRITRANFEVRQALAEHQSMLKRFKHMDEDLSEGITKRIRAACEPLVKYMLFVDEAELTDTIRGTTSFAADYTAGGPRDTKGRSLREFDLNRRMLKYPCSPLIYSSVFDALPAEARTCIYRRLWEVLTGRDDDAAFAHLSDDDRKAIYDILRETKSGLPDYFKPL